MPQESRTRPAPAENFEGPAWALVEPGWRQVFGDFREAGVSIEEHDFRIESATNWGRSFHPGSLEFCLNLAGTGTIRSGAGRTVFGARTAGFYAIGGEGSFRAERAAGERHTFLTIELSRSYLQRHLGEEAGLDRPLADFVTGRSGGSYLGPVSAMTAEQHALTLSLREPPVTSSARPLWYRSKVLEIMSQLLYPSASAEEFFCSRQKRLARERVEGVMMLLRNSLQEPPALDELARQIGCSPFHLSRTFSEQTGLSIPRYLRKVRMERAAELLRSGSYNVTQVAFEVGYSSLGHFSKSFSEVIGSSPSAYAGNRSALSVPI